MAGWRAGVSPNGIKLSGEPEAAMASAPKARPSIAQGGAKRNPGPYTKRVHWNMAPQGRRCMGSQGSASLHPGLSTAGPVGAGCPATKGTPSVAGIAYLMPLGKMPALPTDVARANHLSADYADFRGFG